MGQYIRSEEHLYTDDPINYEEVEGTLRTFIVNVGDVDAYEVQAEDEDAAIQFIIDTQFTDEDYDEYEYDPNYIWAYESED